MKDFKKDELSHIINATGPQFPGLRNPQRAFRSPETTGRAIASVQELIKAQKKTKGFRFDVPTGDQEFQMDLVGDASIYLGLALAGTDLRNGNISLIINNEIIIDRSQLRFLSNEFNDDEYYLFPRPLSGTDDIKVKFQDMVLQQNIDIINYYI